MRCRNCNEEYDEELFPRCPYCLTENVAESNEEENINEKVHEHVTEEESDIKENIANNTQGEIQKRFISDDNDYESELTLNALNISAQNTIFKEVSVSHSTINSQDIEISKIPELGGRAKNILYRNKIFYLSQLKDFVEKNDISKLHNAGKKSIDEIYDVLRNSSVILNGGNQASEKGKSISDSETENKFLDMDIRCFFPKERNKAFITFCDENDLRYMKDLLSFDFSKLIMCKGLSISKIDKIYNNFRNLLKSYGVEVPQDNMESHLIVNESLYSIPLEALGNLGLNKKVMENLLKGKYSTIGDLANITRKELIDIVGIAYIEQLYNFDEYLKMSIKDLLKILLDDLSKMDNYDIVVSRACGSTLQEIATEHNITRERVRQIAAKFNKKILPLAEALCENFIKKNNYATIKDLIGVYDNDIYCKIIVELCKESKKLEYLDFADVFIPARHDNTSTEKLIWDVAGEYIGEGINLYENLEEVEMLMADKGFPYVGFSEFINLAQKYGCQIYGEYILRSKKSYGFLCAKVVAKEFPDGIKIYDNGSGDLDKLRAIVKNKYGDIKIPEKNRALSARLSEFLVLSDRGTFIAKEHVNIDLSLLEKIKEYIDNFNSDTVYYMEIFAEFEGPLKMLSNIDNYNFLHGVLMLYYPDEYLYTRDLLRKKGDTVSKESLSQRIENMIIEKNAPVQRNEIKLKFKGISDSVIFNAINNCDGILQWEYNFYTCEKILYLNSDILQKLESILLKLMDENLEYCSDILLFESVKEKLNEFIVRNNINSAINLFYICEHVFKDKYKFRRPHIIMPGLVECVDTKNIALYLLGNKKTISFSKYTEIANKYMWPLTTYSIAFDEIKKDYIRISMDDYVIKENLSLNDKVIENIEAVLIKNMKNDILAILNFDNWDDLPDIGIEWNPFLLHSIIENYGIKLKIVEQLMKDRRFERGIVVYKDLNINSYPELIAFVLKKNGIHKLSEDKMYSFLILNGLTYKLIPKELYDSKVIEYRDGIFIIN